ncbi:MAG: hypothetical protein V3U09_03885 [Thermoplasmata archaeon]
MADEEWEENPFENRPADKSKVVERETTEPARAVPPPPIADDDNPFERGTPPARSNDIDDGGSPFENRPSDTSFGGGYDDEYVELDEFDKSKLSFVSGIGFVGLVFVLYFFVIVPGNLLLLGLSIAAIVISVLVAFFYLLDDLRIRPSSLTERGARFISGIFFMVLVILLFVPLMMYWPNTDQIDITIPLTLLPIIILTHGSVALFLYSMVWEE